MSSIGSVMSLCFNQDFELVSYKQYNGNKIIETAIENASIFHVYSLLNYDLVNCLKKLEPNKISNFILFYSKKTSYEFGHTLFLLYVAVCKTKDGYYKFDIINWLNWLDKIQSSFEGAYNNLTNINNKYSQNLFNYLSDIHFFKALKPLWFYVPRNKFTLHCKSSIYDCMRIFIKNRQPSAYTKDYTRNVYLHFQNILRKSHEIDYLDLQDFIEDKHILPVTFQNDICIPNTSLVQNIFIPIKGEMLLNEFLALSIK